MHLLQKTADKMGEATASDSVNLGSNPGPPAICFCRGFGDLRPDKRRPFYKPFYQPVPDLARSSRPPLPHVSDKYAGWKWMDVLAPVGAGR